MIKYLDVGCGDGGFDEILGPERLRRGSWLASHEGHDSVGIDIDAEALVQARRSVNHGTRFYQMDVRSLPWPDGVVHTVHGFGLLHHVSDWRRAVRDIARVHHHGGRLELTETVDNWLPYRLARHAVGRWHDCQIHSFFRSEELLSELRLLYDIRLVRYGYRPLVAEMLRAVGREPRWSLAALAVLDGVLAKVGLARHMAAHVYIEAVRK